MLIHEIILNYAKDKKYIKKYFDAMYIFGIALIAIIILLLIFNITSNRITALLTGIGFYLMFPKRIYDNHEFEKNNPHIKQTYYPPSRKGLPGYWCLMAGSIFIFMFLFVLFVDAYKMK